MSIGPEETSSNSIQVQPGPATAGSSSSADPSALIRTPTPPPPKQPQITQAVSQQQQPQQQQQSSKEQHTPAHTPNVTASAHEGTPATAQVAAPAPEVASAPPPRSPPASAVSLHDAAAKAAAAAAAAKNAAGASAPNTGTSTALKNSTAVSVPATSAQPSQAPSASNGLAEANSNTKQPPKPKTTKAPGTAKPKQKRKANQAGIQDELVYRPSPSIAGGTIGATPDASIPAALTAAGGGRKPLPELVLPFQLPYVDMRPEMPILDNASVKAAMAMGASETSSPDTRSDSDDYSVLSDDSDLDSEAEESRREARRRRREPATIEESLVLLQSLRQSRLSHLSSLLTPFSQRVRSGMIYPNVLPLSLLHGLDPRDPHVLIQLGRADIHVGPHVFMKTKFWEVRPDYEMPPVMNPVARMRAPGTFGVPEDYSHMGPSPPLLQQLPQPQPPQLPSPRAPLAMSAAPQAKVALAQPPTAANKPAVVRLASANAQAGTPSTTTTSAAKGQAAIKPATTSTPATLPTLTLPTTPVANSSGVRPPVTTKPPMSAPTAAPTTAESAPISAMTAAAASQASSAIARPSNSTISPAASASASAKPSGSTVTATPAISATGTTGAATESKPAAAVPIPVTMPAKPIAMPVSLPRPPMTTPSLPRPPSISQNNSSPGANSGGALTTATGDATATVAPALPKAPLQPANPATRPGGPPAPVGGAAPSPATSAAAASPATQSAAGSPAPAPASTASKPATPATANTTQASARPAGPPPPPAIDAVLVSRVNATAALNPELQELLHIAASGKANPNQLKALGVWIQAITNQLRQDEARNAAAANNAAGASGSRAGNTADGTADGKKPKKNKVDEAAKASKKQAKIEEREAKKKAKAEAKAKAQADKQMAQKQQKERQQLAQQQLHQQHQQPQPLNKLHHPPPGWPTDGPPKPPVIIVGFRENPSMRFILPLWKCLVERTEGLERPTVPKIKKERRSFFDNDSDDEESQRIEPELKLSFFAPSLGSDAADGSGLRELEEELKRKVAEEAKLNAASTPPNAAQSNGAGNGSVAAEAATSPIDKSEEGAAISKKKKGSGTAGSKKGSKAVKQEAVDSNLSSDYQSKKHEVYPLTWTIKGGVTESLWEAFGRVPGTMTCQPVKREPEIELEPDVAEFLVPEIRYHLLDLPMEEIKIQKETTDTFVDLYGQTPDRRFILPHVAPALLPQGLEDHLQDRFAVRPQCFQGRPIVKRKAGAREDDVSFSYEGIGLTVIGPNGVKTEPGAAPPKPPKRKRHVATHNPDGSIKSCGACGKTKTPMWRRGPKGPSQLCNACGARWKAGRLVVPDVAPPPIIEPEEDKSKEEVRKEDEAKASMHGSNALVIPQSTSVDSGSFTVLAPSGIVGPAPFGDQLFSLASDGKNGMDFGSPHLSRGLGSPSPFIRSPVPEDEVMPASVDPSMLSGTARASSGRR